MKLKRVLTIGLASAGIITAGILYAADHIDSPAVTTKVQTLLTFMYFAVKIKAILYSLPTRRAF